jgi:hypothetical protein
MPWMGFETTISAFERAKTVLALDRAATVIGRNLRYYLEIYLEGLSKTTKNLGRGGRSPGRDQNGAPPLHT